MTIFSQHLLTQGSERARGRHRGKRDRATAPPPRPPRILGALALGAAIIAVVAPRPALALIQPLCPAITCTGSGPDLTVGTDAMAHAEVVPIFWGSYWSSSPAVTRGQILGGIQHLLNGPFVGALNQYGTVDGVGPARMVPGAPIDTSAIVANFAHSDVVRVVNRQIGNGTVPPPVASADIIYAVFLPPGNSSSNFGTNDGYNTGGSCDSTCGSAYAGQSYRMAFIFPGAAATLGTYTKVFSHELAESITHNVSISNCTYKNGNHVKQIGDLCECANEDQLGGTVTVQAYWSQADANCVLPEAWSAVYEFNGTPYGWTQIADEVRQIYAGKFGLVATEVDDNLWLYSGTPYTWTQIGSPGAMFSVGQSWVLGLSPDASAVFRYDGSSWTPIRGPASAIYSGGFDIATNYDGIPFEYLASSGAWTKIGEIGDQFAVGDTFVAAIDPGHDDVFIYPDGGPAWVSTGQAAQEIFIGGHAALAARDLLGGDSGDLLAMTATTSGGTLVPQGWNVMLGPQNTVALWGTSSAKIADLTPARDELWEETAPIEGLTLSWTQIGYSATRLVGGGGHLYATGNVEY
jgi:hypothetical protein